MLAHGKQLPPASLDRVVTARTLLVWLVMISGAITAVALSWHLFQYRRPKPEWACSRCGYDLTGNESGICSECGWVITRQQSE
ncbi:MAG: hypothetical protein DCC75_06080 [Proteobacteria bacterium]|nr:MAG: hypothetical protein DCC75_06080 [Pseudomonadota bacterium]